MPNRLPPLSLSAAPPVPLPAADAAGFGAINQTALQILAVLCRAEAVHFQPCHSGAEDPAQVRRELVAVIERLGFMGRRRREFSTDREVLDFLRECLPCDETSLALIHLVRALSQSHFGAASDELQAAATWARKAVLSPL